MPIKAIAVDIDGTLTDYDRLMDFAGVRALRKVEASGVPVICATGNVAPVTKAFANFAGFTGPIVCENGGAVYSNDMLRHKILFNRKRADDAVAHLRTLGMKVHSIWSDPWRVSEVALSLKMDEAAIRRALDGWGFDIVSTRFAIHIMEPGLDKHKGLIESLEFLPRNVRPTEILSIGDSNNDETMLRGCKYSGCVGNGSERARNAAKFVADKTHGSGVVQILKHYGVA
ncbi:MAG: phosphoglycolate phosphatase [Euryarchaeota archaeon]|nr:phosphoglycolate phosphatase [Euryarchaeota archaeon]